MRYKLFMYCRGITAICTFHPSYLVEKAPLAFQSCLRTFQSCLKIYKFCLNYYFSMVVEEYTYTPIPIRLKQRLTTLDLRHFVWNIGERLGTKNGYNGYARADFIKAMFPDVMKDIEQDSIRNFKFQPNKGSIVIDEPDEDDYHFHIK